MKLKSAKDGAIIDTEKMSDVQALRYEKAEDLVQFGLKYNEYFFLFFTDDKGQHSLHVNLPKDTQTWHNYLIALSSRISDLTNGNACIAFREPKND